MQVIGKLLNKEPIQAPENSFKPILKRCFEYEPARRISAKEAFAALSEMHQANCVICQFQFAPAMGVTCCGADAHFVCFGCFCNYINASCHDQVIETEKISRARARNKDQNSVSPAGCLPCTLFVSGGCSDGKIPETAIMSALSMHDAEGKVTRKYLTTMGRVAVEVYRKEEEERQAKIRAAQTAIKKAVLQVQEVLRCGQTVPCPGCKIPTQKNEECMHMTCGKCRVRYCYVCGINRYRVYASPGGDPDASTRVQCGCDSSSAFLERQPGWGNFKRGTESPGEGALVEFHRCRMARFLRVVKARMDAGLWEQLRRENPNLLADVIKGRSIAWEEIDTAEHAQFGRGTARDTLRTLEQELVDRLFS